MECGPVSGGWRLYIDIHMYILAAAAVVTVAMVTLVPVVLPPLADNDDADNECCTVAVAAAVDVARTRRTKVMRRRVQ